MPAWAVVVAVVAVAGGVAVGLALTRDSTTRSDTGAVSNQLVRGGDLGEVADAQALRTKVEPHLQTSASPHAERPPQAACERTARALQRGDEVLVYIATGRWQGTPAQVLGFSPLGAPATGSRRIPTRVYVLAVPECRVLVFQSYAP